MWAGAVLGTGDPGSRPGRHFFMTRGGRHDHLKKNHLGREAVFHYLSYNCVGNWQISAPCSCRRPCLLRRCRLQLMCEKGEGGRGEGAGEKFTSGSPKGNGQGGGRGDPL